MTLTLIALYLTNSADIKGSYPFTSPFKVFAFTIMAERRLLDRKYDIALLKMEEKRNLLCLNL